MNLHESSIYLNFNERAKETRFANACGFCGQTLIRSHSHAEFVCVKRVEAAYDTRIRPHTEYRSKPKTQNSKLKYRFVEMFVWFNVCYYSIMKFECFVALLGASFYLFNCYSLKLKSDFYDRYMRTPFGFNLSIHY